MSKKASIFQRKAMSFGYRGKEIFKPLRKQKPHDSSAPYDGYKEDDDTEANAGSGYLPKAVPVNTAR